jgi:uncharacterized protein (DUF1778 family)
MAETPKRRRSGSEKRARGGLISFRVAPQERAALDEAAARAGLSLGSYIRTVVIAAPRTRSTRRPSVEVQAVTRLQAEMNRVGGNIHQILRRVNFGETPVAAEFREALTGYREVIAAILAVLGRGRS